MPEQRQDIGPFHKKSMKKEYATDAVLLHRELHLNLNRHIPNGRALKNIGLWSRVHKKPTGAIQKA